MAAENVEMGLATTLPIDVDAIIKQFMGCVFDTDDENTLTSISDRNNPLPSLIEVIIKTIYKNVGTSIEQFITFLQPLLTFKDLLTVDIPALVKLIPNPVELTKKGGEIFKKITDDIVKKITELLKFFQTFIPDPMGFITLKLLEPLTKLKIPIPEIELVPGIKIPKIDVLGKLDTDLFKIKLDSVFANKYGLKEDSSFSDILKKFPSIEPLDLELLPPQFNFFLSIFKTIKEMVMMPINMLIGFITDIMDLITKLMSILPLDITSLIKPDYLATLPDKFEELLNMIKEFVKKLKPDFDFFKNLIMTVIEPLIKPIIDIPNPSEAITMYINQITKIVGKCLPNLLLKIFTELFKPALSALQPLGIS